MIGWLAGFVILWMVAFLVIWFCYWLTAVDDDSTSSGSPLCVRLLSPLSPTRLAPAADVIPRPHTPPRRPITARGVHLNVRHLASRREQAGLNVPCCGCGCVGVRSVVPAVGFTKGGEFECLRGCSLGASGGVT